MYFGEEHHWGEYISSYHILYGVWWGYISQPYLPQVMLTAVTWPRYCYIFFKKLPVILYRIYYFKTWTKSNPYLSGEEFSSIT